jgi:hypothetical protein
LPPLPWPRATDSRSIRHASTLTLMRLRTAIPSAPLEPSVSPGWPMP